MTNPNPMAVAASTAADLRRYPHGNARHLGNPGNCERCHAEHFGLCEDVTGWCDETPMS